MNLVEYVKDRLQRTDVGNDKGYRGQKCLFFTDLKWSDELNVDNTKLNIMNKYLKLV